MPETARMEEVDDSILYHIDFDRVAELNRSAVNLLTSRLCEECPSYGTSAEQINDPQALADEIAENCNEEGYINLNMPLQEIIVRMLLLRGNQPTSLRDIHYELTEKWASPLKPMNVSKKGLQRILEVDNYYGFRAATQDEQGE